MPSCEHHNQRLAAEVQVDLAVLSGDADDRARPANR
jgi:hypothetical protein